MASSSRPVPPRPQLLMATSSFHAGAPILGISTLGGSASRRLLQGAAHRQSSYRYTTFPTQPPKTPSEVDLRDQQRFGNNAEFEEDTTPLPWKQLVLLALLSLSEQTALNSISPYLPKMVGSFRDINRGRIGLHVGLVASAFALAQLTTNLLWGYLSDRIGRKPVMLLGTSLLAGCFMAMGFCQNYGHLVIVQVAMGMFNGNAAIVPTCLGEVTDRSNQSRAFTLLPVIYSLGSITGPALGGLLVADEFEGAGPYPFLAPNMVSVALLIASVLLLGIWFDETLEIGKKKRPGSCGLLGWLEMALLCSCSGRHPRRSSLSAHWPTRTERQDFAQGDDSGGEDDSSNAANQAGPLLRSPKGRCCTDSFKQASRQNSWIKPKTAFRQLANCTTLTVLTTYTVFQLVNVSFNSLYPIFASGSRPTGRELGPETIGLTLSFAGFITILWQILAFPALKARLGNTGTYRCALLGLACSMALMPFVGGRGDFGTKVWLHLELAFVLVIKNIASVGGLSCAMLLITNSAPSHGALGTLQGIAQSLSAAGRSVGPFISGGLFTISTNVHPMGEALAWDLFAGISLLGWLVSLSIRGNELESDDWEGAEDDNGDNGGPNDVAEDEHYQDEEREVGARGERI